MSWSLSPPSKHPANHCPWRSASARVGVAWARFSHTVPQSEPEGQRRAQSIQFLSMAHHLPVLPLLQSLTRLNWLSSSDRLRLICVFLDPATKRLAFLLGPGPEHDMANRSPPNPWIPRNVAPPPDRDPPLFSGRLLFPQWNSLYHSTKIRVSLLRCPFLLPDAAAAVTATLSCCCPFD